MTIDTADPPVRHKSSLCEPSGAQSGCLCPTPDAVIRDCRQLYGEAVVFGRRHDHALLLCLLRAVDALPVAADGSLFMGRAVRGDHPETRLIDLITQDNDGNSTISPERRADYAGAMCWLERWWNGETNPTEKVAIAAALEAGGVTKIASSHRDYASNCMRPGMFGYRPDRDRRIEHNANPPPRGDEVRKREPKNRPADGLAERQIMPKDVAALQSAKIDGWIDPRELIISNPAPKALNLSDAKKLLARKTVERAFHLGNDNAGVIESVRGYHRLVPGWLPSELGIGSYDAQIGFLQERVNALAGHNDSLIRAQRRADDTLRRLQDKVRELTKENGELKRELSKQLPKQPQPASTAQRPQTKKN